jgi:hypothetical protein
MHCHLVSSHSYFGGGVGFGVGLGVGFGVGGGVGLGVGLCGPQWLLAVHESQEVADVTYGWQHALTQPGHFVAQSGLQHSD